MVKVTNPLGSETAHGGVGGFVIFQGTTAKAYRAPVINKVVAQVNANDRFQSATKILQKISPWGRGALRTMLGSNWFSAAYSEVCFYWEVAEAAYNLFSTEQKAEWVANAPYTGTRLDCGLTFYVCAYAIGAFCKRLGFIGAGGFSPSSWSAVMSAGWWKQGLNNVFTAGKYDDRHADFMVYYDVDEWHLIYDENAYAGSYSLSPNSGTTWFSFNFVGSRIGILYQQSPVYFAMLVIIDDGDQVVVSQNGVDVIWQKEWLSPVLEAGLHRVMIFRTGADGRINFDGANIYG